MFFIGHIHYLGRLPFLAVAFSHDDRAAQANLDQLGLAVTALLGRPVKGLLLSSWPGWSLCGSQGNQQGNCDPGLGAGKTANIALDDLILGAFERMLTRRSERARDGKLMVGK